MSEESAAKIRKILNELGDRSFNQNSEQMSMDELLEKLGKKPERNNDLPLSISGGGVHFNIDELERWRKEAEQGRQVDFDRPLPPSSKVKTTAKRAVRKAMRPMIDPMRTDQNSFNLAVVSALNILYNAMKVADPHDVSQGIFELRDRADQVDRQIADQRTADEKIKAEVHDVWSEIDDVRSLIDQTEGKLDDTDTAIRKHIDHEKETLIEQNEALKKEIAELRESMAALSQKIDAQTDTFARYLMEREMTVEIPADRKAADVVPNVAEPEEKKGSAVYDSIDYFQFENRFRGSTDQIKKAQEIYLPYFEKHTNVLDIGCGRGEFLQLMKENGIPAKGVDLYSEYVYFCRLNGLNVVQGDALEYLRSVEDESLGGLFASQLIEHLTNDQRMELCALAYKKLEPGAYFIAETPNPKSLSTFTNAFYIDPSHKNPVHPELMQYYLQNEGFGEVSLLFVEGSKPDYRLPLLDGSHVANLEEFNDGLNLLSDMLFGSMDYAVIAKK